MTVWHLQHHHAGDDMLEVPLGWTFGAVVSDCDMISKIRARQCTRNRHAQPVVSAAKGDAHFRSMRKCSLDFYTSYHVNPRPPLRNGRTILYVYPNFN